ncbi:sigma-54 interaction domain-containing protein [Peptoniphilus indolicus]|uniref:Formate hydrogenlyase transcriptional activator n=2 Tax=Peptoniphilus indolicus TaxID=33030 RepID=A0A379DEG0_9FIRM|nr:sigma 54-interacting transcriptional regulator [Peptoniphilus indolicus]SUB76366.1 Formate hydrogenlyase transcriptional activator [Peptoniphilus indolicus]
MFEIDQIKNSVQDIADAISSILKIEVTIVNKDLRRIAATGNYKDLIGEQLPKGCSYEHILNSKSFESIIERDISDRCKNCTSSENCEEMASIGYPILNDNQEVLGVIGLIAFTQQQRNSIYQNYDSITKFLSKLSILMSRNLQYEQTINDISLKNQEISNIVNSLDSAILFTDKNMIIQNYNYKVYDFLKIEPKKILNKNMTEVFDNFNSSSTTQKLSLKNTKNTNEYLVKTIENYVNGNIESYIFQISKYGNVVKNAYNLIESNSSLNFDAILGDSIAINNTITLAKQISKGNSSVMIRGESGTGKELFARAIHNASDRKNNPFIVINCASIPDNLLESELFGYEKGAFTGANSSGKIGRFELANGGTLFLDEIGDLPIHLQPKLLRVLQDGKFVRLGGKKTIEVNFRLITATNRNLEKMVKTNEFRDDLYFRLSVIPINIPPLRERKSDIPLIANCKLSEYCTKLNKPKKSFSDSILNVFQNIPWEGNIRQLENIIEFLVNISEDDVIDETLLPNHLLSKQQTTSFEINQNISTSPLQEQLDEYEKIILKNMVEKYGSSTKSKQMIADILKINLSTLYRKLYRYNL